MENLKDLLNKYIFLGIRLIEQESLFYFYDGLGMKMDNRTPPRKIPEQFTSENKITALRAEMSKIKNPNTGRLNILMSTLPMKNWRNSCLWPHNWKENVLNATVRLNRKFIILSKYQLIKRLSKAKEKKSFKK
jgi:hypothetical protein